MLEPICRHCVAGVQLFKQCRNLSAGTVLQGCSCLSSVTTYMYLPALCCRGAAVKACSNLSSRHCAAGVQLFKWCHNLTVGTVLPGCNCLSGVETYLPALCPRATGCLSGIATYLPGTVLQGCSFKAVSQSICWHCAAGVQLLKWCQNLSAATVLQGCSCLSGDKTYLRTLCCRGAAV